MTILVLAILVILFLLMGPSAILTDGYQTLVSIGGTIFKERETQPPGLDSGGPIDTTTMRNLRYRTMQPKHLVTATEIKIKAEYDPIFYQVAVSTLLGVNGTITVTFPDGSSILIWGWLDKLIPDSHKEGEVPTAEVTIHPSNQNNSGVEQSPIYTP
jgi:hypothetical protein